MRVCSQLDTIAAIATPAGRGGIGIVRVSGPSSRGVLSALWAGKPGVEAFESHRLYHGPVRRDGTVIDRVMVSWMKAPRSYTGEDVVEISGHGGPAVMKRLLEACVAAGARPAGPGEFTRRAFMNGKLDLAQAEAVADVIAASGEQGLRQAQDQLAGTLSAAVNDLHRGLTEIRACVEASIDFPEDDIDSIAQGGIVERLGKIVDKAERLAATFDEGRLLRDGVRVIVAGMPNAGKSSLFNALVGRDRALVHVKPGTTRDVVEESIDLGGMTFHLRDTAGLRDTKCDVERMGVARTREEMRDADIVLYVIDAAAGTTSEDEEALKELGDRPAIVVHNKCDLDDALSAVPARGSRFTVHASAKTGAGLDALRDELLSSVRAKCADGSEGAVVTRARHREALDGAIDAMGETLNAIDAGDPLECTAQHLRRAQDALGGVTGEVATDDLLDEIFSRFCIGK